jgi:DNA-binding MarR family transcriptional regulator
VTGLVDRLSRKGFVRRVPDPEDRRRVRVELIHEHIEAMAPLFTGLIEGLVRVCRGYSADDLNTIARWLEEAADCQRDAAATLAESDAEG